MSDQQKIGVFVDVQNIYYTTRQAYSRQFNYKELWQRVSASGDVVLANAYATHRNDERQFKFQSALRAIGFNVILKPYLKRSDGTAKADWDVGIAVDVMEAAPTLDTVVLLSGDGDFDLLLAKIKKNYGVRTEVYGVPTLTSNLLIDASDSFYAIEDDLLL
ncbi:MAG: NYN domain-containing protein [Pseudomonadota bacterium]